MRKAILTRTFDDGVQSLGNIIQIVDKNIVGEFKSLELTWEDNENEISCIPKGWYNAIPYDSPSKGKVYLLEYVYNREFIEIHSGNYYTQILGCILIGDKFIRINNDELYDVSNSVNSLKSFRKAFDYKSFLLIVR